MSYELFAFRVAEPVRSGMGLDGMYNPATQTSTWESDGTVHAVTKAKCSQWYQGGTCCNHYGNYCENFGCDYQIPPQICDNLA